MIALMGYTWSGLLRSQRFAAPMLCFFVFESIIDANSGSVLPSYALSATVLLFISTWMTIVIVNNEDPVQAEVTAVTAGSLTKVRAANLLTAYAVAAGLGAIGLIGPAIAASQNLKASVLAAGAAAHLITGAAGVALGALCSRPIIGRTAWALFIAVIVDFAEIIVPRGVPTRQLLALLNEVPPTHLALAMTVIAAETLLLGAVAVVASMAIAPLRD